MVSSDRLAQLVDVVLAKKAPRTIPRSGDSAKTVDCYSVSFMLDGAEYLLDGRTGTQIECRRWAGRPEGFSLPASVSIYDLWGAEPDIRHFLGYYELKWTSWADFSFDQATRWIYLKVALNKIRQRLSGLYVARKKLVTVERYIALKAVWDLQMERDESVGQFAVLMKIHGDNYFLHPNHEAAGKRMRAVLDALAETGELKVTKLNYVVTGTGLSMLERIEEEDRRHQDSMRTHRRMFWLTVILMASAVIQAGILDLPSIFSMERWPWQSQKVVE